MNKSALHNHLHYNYISLFERKEDISSNGSEVSTSVNGNFENWKNDYECQRLSTAVNSHNSLVFNECYVVNAVNREIGGFVFHR